MIPLEKLLSVLPISALDRLALSQEVDKKNQFKLPGVAVFICLLNSIVNHPFVTQRLLEETYNNYSGQTADHSSFGKRLAQIKVSYFEAIFWQLHSQLASRITMAEQNALKLRLRFVDATTISLSAKLIDFGIRVGTRGRRHRKVDGSSEAVVEEKVAKRNIKAVFELSDDGLPALLHVCREQNEASDEIAIGQTMREASNPGDLWVFDRGCRSVSRLLALHDAGAFFLTPQSKQNLLMQGSHDVIWEAATPLCSPPPLRANRENLSDAMETPGKSQKDLEGELRSEGREADEETFRLLHVERVRFSGCRDKGAKGRLPEMPVLAFVGERYDRRAMQWKPMTLLTNLPLSEDGTHAGPYPLASIPQLYKRRWEIETFFKFIKQYLGYEHLTSRTENGITVMIYMSLIAALLLTWYKRETRIDRGWRSVKYWFAEDARQWTRQLLQDILAKQKAPPLKPVT
jgi:hypothetical protein